ncbi:hypothetical protein BU23DRAFT_129592 [Bimuria novae-zelandiae CBS 107.79]|uniref:Uncharacterized protein n=1 Tax=Bimuria novae-zelandiae CBS 107.79 TaxID=1447943 RepID=A0A6A5VK26_9PLEO|nr:hypothetical protein BU23DRAFT_129586 [Bimuria novae-zelandiae CBS 107.79]KAF1973748.1 hypothetical protein BU23DRAFT_129592 [Bimuria novae-zelandiae CBS 107.79]
MNAVINNNPIHLVQKALFDMESSTHTHYSHTLLQYYVLFTSLLGLLGYISLNLSPAAIRDNYTPSHRARFTPLAARSLGAWFFLCMVLRCGAWVFWGEKGWYDTCMVSLAVPLMHYTVEKAVFGSVGWRQVFLAYGIDGGGLVWMWMVRREVLGL